jgi:hypothetical protein
VDHFGILLSKLQLTFGNEIFLQGVGVFKNLGECISRIFIFTYNGLQLEDET